MKLKGGLKAVLTDKLEPNEIKQIYKSYDIIGDIAVIRVPKGLERHSKIIAEAIMQTHRRVKGVWRQITPVFGDFRLRKLEWIMGEKRTETVHKEHGCSFKVDIEKCYFSPRLSYERMRIAKQIHSNEVIVNMFAGVGCYSIIIAKHSQAKRIYSIDINPVAVRYMKENVRLNRVEDKVICVLGDAKEILKQKMKKQANRILMPLPEKAYEYLNYAMLVLKPPEGHLYYYGFEHAKKDENPLEKVKQKVSEKLRMLDVDFEITSARIVRTTGPRWYQVVLDILILARKNQN